jgi:hypothetical protein
MVDEALGEDELDGRAGALVCGLGDKGTEFRSGGMINNLTSALLVSVDLQRVRGSRIEVKQRNGGHVQCPASKSAVQTSQSVVARCMHLIRTPEGKIKYTFTAQS